MHISRQSSEAFNRVKNEVTASSGKDLRNIMLEQAVTSYVHCVHCFQTYLCSGITKEPPKIASDLKEALSIIPKTDFLSAGCIGRVAVKFGVPSVAQEAVQRYEGLLGFLITATRLLAFKQIQKAHVLTEMIECELASKQEMVSHISLRL